jgi:hypothetical protein
MSARYLVAPLVAIIGTLTLISHAAYAQVEVESTVEGGHCSVVTINEETGLPEGGCLAHVVSSSSTVDLFRHTPIGETLSTGCQFEADRALGEDGEGYVYNQNV